MASISSKVIREHIFFSGLNPRDSVAFFIDALEKLPLQNKAQMEFNFLQTVTSTKKGFARILESLNRGRIHSVGINGVDDNSRISSTQFLQMQKNELNDLREHFERYCTTFLVFEFNCARYDINLLKCYLILIVAKERDIESIAFERSESISLRQIQ